MREAHRSFPTVRSSISLEQTNTVQESKFKHTRALTLGSAQCALIQRSDTEFFEEGSKPSNSAQVQHTTCIKLPRVVEEAVLFTGTAEQHKAEPGDPHEGGVGPCARVQRAL